MQDVGLDLFKSHRDPLTVSSNMFLCLANRGDEYNLLDMYMYTSNIQIIKSLIQNKYNRPRYHIDHLYFYFHFIFQITNLK